MYRINTYNLEIGENNIFLPEDTQLSDVKSVKDKIILVTLEPVVWARAESRKIMVVLNKRTAEVTWEFVGSAIVTSEFADSVFDLYSVFDATKKYK